MKNTMEGIVIESRDYVAKVKLSRHGECANCGSCSGAGAEFMQVCNKVGAKPGQNVTVEIERNNLVKSAFIVFLLPLIAVAAGYSSGFFLSHMLHSSPVLMETAGIIICLAISIFIIRRFDSTVKKSSGMPNITHVH